MVKPLVVVIILNWNKFDETLDCLNSIKLGDYDNYQVVVVDNNSSDYSVATIKKAHPWVTMIENDRNLGFTGGNNVGIRYALEQDAEYVWLLNNDTVVAPDCLSRLVAEQSASPNVGMVSPVIYYFDDRTRVQFCGSYLDWSTYSVVYPEDKVALPPDCYTSGDDVCLWGTALLLSRPLIEQIGYLNDEYFAYWEDTEYSIRVLTAGLKNRVCTSAAIYHKTPLPGMQRPRSRPHATYLMLRNRYLLYAACLSGPRFRKFFREFLAELIVELGYAHRFSESEAVAACYCALRDALLRKGGPVPSFEGRYGGWWFPVVTRIIAWHPYLWAHMVRGDISEFGRKTMARMQRQAARYRT